MPFDKYVSVKRNYYATNKQVHSQYLFTIMSSIKRSYNAANKQVQSQ